mmetsp:Transcript_5349/g.7829  ORF Transcript_5349/g.7829 Transcript_5349/m.7829 type:complete len:460 (+) Transcript_5349:106-1485(+)
MKCVRRSKLLGVCVMSIATICANGIRLDSNPSMTLGSSKDDCIPPHCPPPPPPPPPSVAASSVASSASVATVSSSSSLSVASSSSPPSPFLSPWGQLQPHHQPHQPHHHHQEESSVSLQAGWVPRGGASIAAASLRATTPPPAPSRHQSPQRRKPIINPATISLALRLTSEMNRQLQPPPSRQQSSSHTTIFHSPSSSSSHMQQHNKRGIERYGPNLTSYISKLLSSLQIQNKSLVLLLSVIYLDRACSLETPRSSSSPSQLQSQQQPSSPHDEMTYGQGLEHLASSGTCPPLPYITPRTVHKLITTAIILAHEAVHPSSSSSSSSSFPVETLLKQANMTYQSLSIMKNYMLHAMGDLGLYVSVDVLHYWMDSWGSIFGILSSSDTEQEEEEYHLLDNTAPPPQPPLMEDVQRIQSLHSSSLYSISSEDDDDDENGGTSDDHHASYWGNTHEAAMSCWS